MRKPKIYLDTSLTGYNEVAIYLPTILIEGDEENE